MKFSTKSSYGLRVMIQLADNYNQGSLSLKKIAESEKLSLGYLEAIAAKLKSQKLIKSTKGVNGGYQLTREPKDISIKEIFVALEGTISPFYCAEPERICKVKNCGARKVWEILNIEISKTLDKMKLKDLIK